MKETVKQRTLRVCSLLEESKAIDIRCYDVEDLVDWSLFAVIATATSQAHLRGIINRLDQELANDEVIKILQISSNPSKTSWIVIDCGDTIIHCLLPDAREYYKLDDIWNKRESLFEMQGQL